MNEIRERVIEQKVTVREIANVLEEEAEANRESFKKDTPTHRWSAVSTLNSQHPEGESKRLFELGDKLRGEYLKKNANRALESILGSPLGEEEINKLRTLVKGDKAISLNQHFNTNAYMPDTSTSTKSGSDQNRTPNYESELDESIKKGDVDGVISALFKKPVQFHGRRAHRHSLS